MLRMTTAWNDARRLELERLDEILHDAVDVGEVRFAARAPRACRRTGATHRHRRGHRRADGGVKVPTRWTVGQQGSRPGSTTGLCPAETAATFELVRIDTPDIVAVGGQTGSGDGADVAEPEDSDLHARERCVSDDLGMGWRHTKTSVGEAMKYTAPDVPAVDVCPGGLFSATCPEERGAPVLGGAGAGLGESASDDPSDTDEVRRRAGRLLLELGRDSGVPVGGPIGPPGKCNSSQLGAHAELLEYRLDL